MKRAFSVIRAVVAAVIVVTAFWNIWIFFYKVAALPPRETEGMVLQEDRYRAVRDLLKIVGYSKGPIQFVTNRDLKAQERISEDNAQWTRAQYVMTPWILLSQRKPVWGPSFSEDAPYVVGDFWDGPPTETPPGLVPILDTGKGVVLFRRKPQP